MCGIGSITLSKTASPKLAANLDRAASALLLALDHRGGDACGLLSIRADGRIATQKAPCRAREFNQGRAPLPIGTRAVAVHTRFATQGEAHWNRNNHPVRAAGALVLHNGVIYDHTKRRPGDPEVDTYALALAAAAIAAPASTTTATTLALALDKLDGSAAVHVAHQGTPSLTTIRLTDSPLWFAEVAGARITASTREAVLHALDVLGLEVTATETYQHTVRAPKWKGNRIKKQGVYETRTREKITEAPEGTILLWHAGQHLAASFTPSLPSYTRHWTSYTNRALWDDDDAYYADAYTKPTTSNTLARIPDHDYASIAARLLDAPEGMACDMCKTATTRLTPAYGSLICDECLDSIDEAMSTPQAHEFTNSERNQ